MMTEFVQTMKDWKRMCIWHEAQYGDNSCEHCPVAYCGAIFETSKNYDWQKLAQTITAWAAEHPEPVYPTWGEWLLSIGVAKRVHIGNPWPVEMADGSMIEPCYDIVVDKNIRITAYDAQKLGIEPKEG